MRLAAATATVSALIFGGATTTKADETPPITRHLIQQQETVTYQGKGVRWWASRAIRNRRTLNRFRHVMLEDGTVTEAINLACAVYGNCSTLWRKARCESHLFAGAHNPSGASGLFQFLPSTWRGTPFGAFSIWSPYANAMAAGWMHARGRGGEWVCQ